jgi:hypothetical protein
MFTAVTHKNLADAQKHFSGHPLQNYFVAGKMAGAGFGLNFFSQLAFPVAFTRHNGRKFPKASYVCETPLPVCHRVGFQFGGRINDRNEKILCFKMKLNLLKTS